MWIFLALVVVPIIEIALFIEVGGWLGLWPTIAIVVLTALIGSVLLRSQGLAAMMEVRRRAEAGQNPGPALAHGALILVSGIVLLTPGFFTDAVGFLLLLPPVRAVIIEHLAKRIAVASFTAHAERGPANRGARPDIIDGAYEEVDPEDAADPPESPRGSSGWTRPGR